MPRGRKKDSSVNDFGKDAYNTKDLTAKYVNEVDTNPEYSLVIDKSKFTEEECEFLRLYYDFRNINTVAEVMGMEIEVANALFVKPSILNEIHRLDKAVYHHQFSKNLITIDEIGGYLSSLLTDDFVPLAHKLTPELKLKIADMILKINVMKLEAFSKPEDYSYQDVETQIKDMSVNAIKKLLEANPDRSPIDVSSLNDKRPEELLKLVDATEKQIVKQNNETQQRNVDSDNNNNNKGEEDE